jgi:glycosyltransferase involved in cell wall biosynthesis
MPALISIITPSFNQAKFLPETLDSLLAQNYPDLEVIIQDGGSKDGSVEIAQEYVRRYPSIFRLYVEKDDGQADALNRGFSKARGEIFGFLNSDDTLCPGCLQRVAEEIDVGKDRLVVFGRCLFTGEGSSYVGVEHPAVYKSHFEHLAIWKRGHNSVPQPSVFWHRQVWERCGGFDVSEAHALDYDLFCRFSRRYFFHRVDEIWSTYRMHAASKSSQKTEDEVLKLSIRVSRKYWGRWYSPLRWRCELSHWWHDPHRHELARHHAREAEQAVSQGRRFYALKKLTATIYYSPKMAWHRLIGAWTRGYAVHFVDRFLWTEEAPAVRHSDGWIGPHFKDSLAAPQGGKLVAILEHSPQGPHRKVNVRLLLDGQVVAQKTVTQAGQFALTGSSPKKASVIFEIRSDSYFVPRLVHGTPDDRKLSLQLLQWYVEKTP